MLCALSVPAEGIEKYYCNGYAVKPEIDKTR